MILLSRNCRGLGNLRTVRALQSLVKKQGPGVLFLMETKLDSRDMESIRVLLRFNNLFVVPSHGRSGGLAMLWRTKVGLEIHNYSRHHIDCGVCDNDGKEWRLTGFYGHPEFQKRGESCALLDHRNRLAFHPWLCMGDFNEVMFALEHRGQHPRLEGQMQVFQEVLARCQLGDMGFQGSEFTWDNRRRGSDFVQMRLDRVVSNVQWQQWFPASSVVHLPCLRSDHALILVRVLEHHNPPKR
jgi:exonuclease III